MTVLSDRKTSAAISLLVLPSATSSRIFCSCCGQLRELVGVRAGRDAPDALEDLLGDRRVEQRLAPPDRLQRGDEVPRADLLEQVAAGAGDDRREHGLLVGIAGQHHDAGVGQLRADLAAGLDARAVRQPDVHDDDVGLEPAGRLDRLGDRARLGDDLEPVAAVEQGDQALADDLVVVDHQQAIIAGRVAHVVLPRVQSARR